MTRLKQKVLNIEKIILKKGYMGIVIVTNSYIYIYHVDTYIKMSLIFQRWPIVPRRLHFEIFSWKNMLFGIRKTLPQIIM